MRATSAPSAAGFPWTPDLPLPSLSLGLPSDGRLQRHCRHASIRTLMAAFAAVPIGVLNSGGAAISVTT